MLNISERLKEDSLEEDKIINIFMVENNIEST